MLSSSVWFARISQSDVRRHEEQMEIFLEYHNTTAGRRGGVNGNVGRMSCKFLRTRPLWLWLQLKEETRTSLSQK